MRVIITIAWAVFAGIALTVAALSIASVVLAFRQHRERRRIEAAIRLRQGGPS